MINIKTINAKQLKKKLDDNEDILVIDVLPRSVYSQKHIPKSKSIPFDKLEKQKKKFPKDKDIIVYCASFECQASAKAAKMIKSWGYDNVIEYEGGVEDWENKGFDLEGSEA